MDYGRKRDKQIVFLSYRVSSVYITVIFVFDNHFLHGLVYTSSFPGHSTLSTEERTMNTKQRINLIFFFFFFLFCSGWK